MNEPNRYQWERMRGSLRHWIDQHGIYYVMDILAEALARKRHDAEMPDERLAYQAIITKLEDGKFMQDEKIIPKPS